MGFQSFFWGWFLFLSFFIYLFEASEVVFQLVILKV